MKENYENLSREELLDAWVKMFGKAPAKGLNRAFLIKHLIYQEQANKSGELSQSSQRFINKLISKYETSNELKDSDVQAPSGFTLQAGTKLIREFRGEKHEVKALEKGFEYRGKAQKLLLENRVDKDCNTKAASNSLLANKLFDDKNNRMSPSHSNTRGRKYRYYVSLAVTKCNKTKAGSVSKIPAGEIEKFVTDNIKGFLQDKKEIQKYIKNLDVAGQNKIFERLEKLDYTNPRLIRGILDRATVSKEWIEIIFCKNQIQKMLENFAYCDEIPAEIKSESHTPLTIKKDIRIATTSRAGGYNVIIIPSEGEQTPMPNASLIKLIVKSHHWNELLLTGKVKNTKCIQKFENHADSSYIKRVLNLRFLSPEITEAILNGTQPRDLTVTKLFDLKTLDWSEQKKILKCG